MALREANNDIGVRDLDTGLVEEFRARKKRRDELWQRRDEEVRGTRELEQMTEEINAEKARTRSPTERSRSSAFSV
jgi:hypothetical protein